MSLANLKATTKYQEAIQAIEEIESPAVGFAKTSNYKGGLTNQVNVVIKQNNTLLYLASKQSQKLNELEEKFNRLKQKVYTIIEKEIQPADLDDSISSLSKRLDNFSISGIFMIRLHALHRRSAGTNALVVLRDTRWEDCWQIIGTMEVDLSVGTQLVYMFLDMVQNIDDFHNHMEVVVQTHGYDTWQGGESNLLVTMAMIAIPGERRSVEEPEGMRWNLKPSEQTTVRVPSRVAVNERLNRSLSLQFERYRKAPQPGRYSVAQHDQEILGDDHLDEDEEHFIGICFKDPQTQHTPYDICFCEDILNEARTLEEEPLNKAKRSNKPKRSKQRHYQLKANQNPIRMHKSDARRSVAQDIELSTAKEAVKVMRILQAIIQYKAQICFGMSTKDNQWSNQREDVRIQNKEARRILIKLEALAQQLDQWLSLADMPKQIWALHCMIAYRLHIALTASFAADSDLHILLKGIGGTVELHPLSKELLAAICFISPMGILQNKGLTNLRENQQVLGYDFEHKNQQDFFDEYLPQWDDQFAIQQHKSEMEWENPFTTKRGEDHTVLYLSKNEEKDDDLPYPKFRKFKQLAA
ncbi:hypothetical protein Tco_1310908 [Tanacetum coccineum]